MLGLTAYWVLSAPIYVPWHITFPQPLAEAITWLPYLAAFVSGVIFSHFSPSGQDRDCVLLGISIGFSVGLVNLAGPLIGFHSDLPGLNYSIFIAVVATIISVLLVLAGAGTRNFFNENEKRT